MGIKWNDFRLTTYFLQDEKKMSKIKTGERMKRIITKEAKLGEFGVIRNIRDKFPIYLSIYLSIYVPYYIS